MAKADITVRGTRFIVGDEAKRFVALSDSLRRCLHRRWI
jgi:hypothetical protein